MTMLLFYDNIIWLNYDNTINIIDTQMIDFEKLLKDRGKSKADLARFLEIDPSNVNRTIKNDNIPLSKIESICSFLGISIIDAFRASGYDDTPGVTPKATEKEKISDYKDLLLSLSDQLVELYNQKVLAPYTVVEGKEEEIRKLNREIGKLESEIERLKRIFENDQESRKIFLELLSDKSSPIWKEIKRYYNHDRVCEIEDYCSKSKKAHETYGEKELKELKDILINEYGIKEKDLPINI